MSPRSRAVDEGLPPTEAANPSTVDLDALGTLALLHRINDEDRGAAPAVERALDAIAAAVDAIAERLSRGGSLHYFGAGTSGRLGVLDAAEMPPTFATNPDMVVAHIAGGPRAMTQAVEAAEDDDAAGGAEARAARLSHADVAVGISASGATAYVLGAIGAARDAGALAICITNSPGSPLERAADIAIVLATGPEALAGSTRMKAASAQRMALTMMSTAIMVKLGKVYENLMVDVSPTNKKLRARALRLTKLISGADDAAAHAALEASRQRVKIAVLMLVRTCSVAEAEETLTRCGGSLRAALRAH